MQAVAVLGCILLLLAALGDHPAPWVAATAATVGLAALVRLLRPAREPAWEIAVADDGTALGRRSPAPDQRLHCIFESSWLITFRAGRDLIAVWPDSLPAGVFRRLWVLLHWRLPRSNDKTLDLTQE